MSSSFSTFAEVQAWLDGLGLFHMDLTLERMKRFLGASRLFALTYGPPFAVIHVVGANGKGSTAAFLDSLAGFHDYSSGLYLSPHFLTPRERIRVDGDMLSEGDWLEGANEVMAGSGDDPAARLTYFEFLTALALVLFTREGVDVAVLEAGLGGRFDATTALTADLTVFTPIGLDHQDRLGRTIEEIARDKAGAIKPGAPVVSAPQEPAVEAILREAARQASAPFFLSADILVRDGDRFVAGPLCPAFSEQDCDPPLVLPAPRPAMRGVFQEVNLHAALAAWTLFLARRSARPDPQACLDAAQEAFLPGRLQFVPAEDGWPALVLDAAHNAHALPALAQSLAAESVRPAAVIFTCLRDKNLDDMAPHVLALTDGPILVPELPGLERARPAAEVVAVLGPRARAVPDLDAALTSPKLDSALVSPKPDVGSASSQPDAEPASPTSAVASGPVLVCGSLYLLAEVYRRRPALLDPPD